jgi:hypothetical protein
MHLKKKKLPLLLFLFYFLILNLFFIELSHSYNMDHRFDRLTRLAKAFFIYLIF